MSEDWFAAILRLHIFAGAVALGVLAVPYLSKKGGRVHRRSGWIFALSMAAVGTSAWLLALGRLSDGDPRNNEAAWFLAHVGVFSTTSVWAGARSLRRQRKTRARDHGGDAAVAAVLLCSSLALGGYGLACGEVLMLVFSALGLFTAIPQLRFWLGPYRDDQAWLVQHLSSMSNGAISAITAFFVVNVQRWGWGDYQLLFWIVPGLVGGSAVTFYASRLSRPKSFI